MSSGAGRVRAATGVVEPARPITQPNHGHSVKPSHIFPHVRVPGSIILEGAKRRKKQEKNVADNHCAWVFAFNSSIHEAKAKKGTLGFIF